MITEFQQICLVPLIIAVGFPVVLVLGYPDGPGGVGVPLLASGNGTWMKK